MYDSSKCVCQRIGIREVQQFETVKMTTSHQRPESTPIYELSLRPRLDAQSSDNPADEMRNSGRSSRLVTVMSLF